MKERPENSNVVKLPTISDRSLKEMEPFIKQAARVISLEVRRHLSKHHPEILNDPAKVEAAGRTYYAFLCDLLASGARDEAIKLAGSEEKYFELLAELTRHLQDPSYS